MTRRNPNQKYQAKRKPTKGPGSYLQSPNFKTACEYAQPRSDESPNFIFECETAAQKAESQGDFSEAINLWFRIFIRKSDRIEPRRRLNQAIHTLEKNKRNIKDIDQQLLSDLRKSSSLHKRFRSLASSDANESAIEAFVSACFFLDLKEDNFRVFFLIANYYFNKSLLQEAKRCYLFALTLQPQHEASLRRLGRITYLQKDHEASRIIWGLVLQVPDAQHYDAITFLGRIARQRRENLEALLFFNLAITADPYRVNAYKDLFSMHVRLKQYGEAQDVFASFIEALPESIEAYLMRVEIAFRQRNLIDTERAFNLLLERFSHEPAVWRTYTRFIAGHKSLEENVSFWRDVCEKHPESLAPRLEILRVQHSDGGTNQEVLEASKALLELDPENREGLLRTAQYLRMEGATLEAFKYFQLGAALYPGDAEFISSLISMHMSADQIDEAKALATEFDLRTLSSSSEEFTSKASLFYQAECNDKAVTLLNSAIRKFPDSSNCHSLLADIQIKSGRYHQALKSVNAARSIDPENAQTAKNYARVHAFIAFVSNSGSCDLHGASQIFLEAAKHIPIVTSPPTLDHLALITSTLGAGGAERQVANTIRGLKQSGASIQKLSLFANSLNPYLGHDFFLKKTLMNEDEITNLKLQRESRPLRQLVAEDLISRELAILLGIFEENVAADIAAIFIQLVSQKVTIAHFWQDYTAVIGGFAAVLAGVPVIVLSSRSTRPETRRRLKPYMRDVYKILVKKKNVFMLNNSRFGARDYEAWLDMKPGSMHVIHNGIDIRNSRKEANLLSESQIRKQLSIPSSASILGGVMRFSEEKRPELWLDVAISMCSLDPSMHFILVGEGPLRSVLEPRVLAAGLDDRIHIPGRKNPVEPWIAAMDLLFLSSRVEGLPNVLIEAQALGVPVASMAVGGAAETFKDGETGILIRSEAPATIADAIYAFMGNKDAMAHARQLGPQHVEGKFSIEAMTRNTLSFYKSIIHSCDARYDIDEHDSSLSNNNRT